jgi:colicin import membrane protein
VPLEQPKPVVKPAPKVEPKPVLKPDPELKVDIAIKKKPIEKPLEKVKPKEDKKPDALAELQKQMMQDAIQKHEKVADNDALKQLQQDISNGYKAEAEQKNSVTQAAVNVGVIGELTGKIKAKIRGNVNKSLCGGDPELKFEIALLPTGELSSHPRLVKSSGSAACDDAVERAILASEPLPLPNDTSLFSQFRNLKLTFRPNGN